MYSVSLQLLSVNDCPEKTVYHLNVIIMPTITALLRQPVGLCAGMTTICDGTVLSVTHLDNAQEAPR